MIGVALAVGLLVLVAGVACAAALGALPTLRLQLAALVLAAVSLPLAVVLLSGWVMFGMHADVKVATVSVASALAALAGAALMSRRILRPLERLREAAAQLAGGELSARASEVGPRELHDVSASFNEMAANIERLFDARRQLVAGASHDLRTPLASLSAMVEALEDGLATPREYLPEIREQVRILTLLVEDLFELARIDAGVVPLEVRDSSLRDLISRCVLALRADAQTRDVRLEERMNGTDPSVLVAPEKIERVLRNLLANAVRHTPRGGVVSVVVEADTDLVVVAVEDTGNGVTDLAAQRMFDLFWREDSSRARSTGGAGLGLAIAQGLVRAHGGRIWAENRDSGGARVAFTLPLARAS